MLHPPNLYVKFTLHTLSGYSRICINGPFFFVIHSTNSIFNNVKRFLLFAFDMIIHYDYIEYQKCQSNFSTWFANYDYSLLCVFISETLIKSVCKLKENEQMLAAI